MAVLLILLLPVAFGASYWLVGVVRRYALAAEVVDLPNERSLHQGRVARGGGLAIVILAVLAFGAAMFWWTGMALVGWPLLLVTLALAILGWIDDHYDLRVAVRILAQFLVAGAFVSWVGSVATFALADGWIIHTGMLAMPLTVVWIVWMANLYNFMDGIDGLAGLQGMIGSATLGLWFYWVGAPGLAGVCLVLCGACGGFLAWNWAPARVFMGDVGSVTLGGLFAALSVVAATRYDMPIIAFVILFIVFIGDATLTLVRRVMRREPFWQAHRSHYYQRAVQSGMSHSDVTKRMGGMAAISACLATLVVTGNAEPWSAMALALFLFAVVVFRVNRLEQSARVNQVK